ncbi:MAG: ankyrin repeat domain-containing protein [Desulfobacterales bacterium]
MVLISHGADVNHIPAMEGRTALTAACAKGHIATVRAMLLDKGADMNAVRKPGSGVF